MSLTTEQTDRLQNEVQQELERREWAEAGDSVMAEYVCVLLGNGNDPSRVKTEMEDLVGTDFDDQFLDWLFARRDAIITPAAPPTAPAPITESRAPPAAAPPAVAPASSRMFASAIEGTKRKAEAPPDAHNKRRLPDRPLGAPGPRMQDRMNGRERGMAPGGPGGPGGRSLSDRLGMGPGPGPRGAQAGRELLGRPGRDVRGPNGPMGNQPFRPHNVQQNQQQFMPGQQEMMMQMMAMQANMMQMAEQMKQMQNPQDTPTQRGARPGRAAPAKVPAGTKLGGHAVSSIQPKGGALGPIPDKPSSTALCKFGVGCSNARCTYSHPSPVADEKTGMVLSEEPCEAGRNCKDPECVKSHVSPAVVNGDGSGPSRVLCKFQHCTNASCQFRHEDADGNFIPPPALGKTPAATPAAAAAPAGTSGLDAALDDTKAERPCRYGERCTRADCKFTHPASRPTPRGAKPTPARGGARAPAAFASAEGIVGGMTKSSKFAPKEAAALNPAASEFKPAGSDPALEITM